MSAYCRMKGVHSAGKGLKMPMRKMSRALTTSREATRASSVLALFGDYHGKEKELPKETRPQPSESVRRETLQT